MFLSLGASIHIQCCPYSATRDPCSQPLGRSTINCPPALDMSHVPPCRLLGASFISSEGGSALYKHRLFQLRGHPVTVTDGVLWISLTWPLHSKPQPDRAHRALPDSLLSHRCPGTQGWARGCHSAHLGRVKRKCLHQVVFEQRPRGRNQTNTETSATVQASTGLQKQEAKSMLSGGQGVSTIGVLNWSSSMSLSLPFLALGRGPLARYH